MLSAVMEDGTSYQLNGYKETRAMYNAERRDAVQLVIPLSLYSSDSVYQDFAGNQTDKLEIWKDGAAEKIFTDYSILISFSICPLFSGLSRRR